MNATLQVVQGLSVSSVDAFRSKLEPINRVATTAFTVLRSGVFLVLNPGMFVLGFVATILHPKEISERAERVEAMPFSFSRFIVDIGNPALTTMIHSVLNGVALARFQANPNRTGWVLGPGLRRVREWAKETANEEEVRETEQSAATPSLLKRIGKLALLWIPTVSAALASPFYLVSGTVFGLLTPETGRAYRQRLVEHLKLLTAEEVLLGTAITYKLSKHILPLAVSGWAIHLAIELLDEADRIHNGIQRPLRVDLFDHLPSSLQGQLTRIRVASQERFRTLITSKLASLHQRLPVSIETIDRVARSVVLSAVTCGVLKQLPGPTLLGAGAAIFFPNKTSQVFQTVSHHLWTMPITTQLCLGATLCLRATTQVKFLAAAAIGVNLIQLTKSEVPCTISSQLPERALEALKWIGSIFLAVKQRNVFAFSFFAAVMQPAWAERVTERVQAAWNERTDLQRLTILAVGCYYHRQAGIIASVAAGSFLMQKVRPETRRRLPEPTTQDSTLDRVRNLAYKALQLIRIWVPFFTNPGVFRAGSLTSVLFRDQFGQGIERLRDYWNGLPTRLHQLAVGGLFVYAFGTTSTIFSFATGAMYPASR